MDRDLDIYNMKEAIRMKDLLHSKELKSGNCNNNTIKQLQECLTMKDNQIKSLNYELIKTKEKHDLLQHQNELLTKQLKDKNNNKRIANNSLNNIFKTCQKIINLFNNLNDNNYSENDLISDVNNHIESLISNNHSLIEINNTNDSIERSNINNDIIADVVPHYRRIILKFKEKIIDLSDKLDDEKNKNEQLSIQLRSSYNELRKVLKLLENSVTSSDYDYEEEITNNNQNLNEILQQLQQKAIVSTSKIIEDQF